MGTGMAVQTALDAGTCPLTGREYTVGTRMFRSAAGWAILDAAGLAANKTFVAPAPKPVVTRAATSAPVAGSPTTRARFDGICPLTGRFIVAGATIYSTPAGWALVPAATSGEVLRINPDALDRMMDRADSDL